MSDNWKEVLRAQQADLAELEALDAEISGKQISADIDKLLKRPVRTDVRLGSRGASNIPIPPKQAVNSVRSPPKPALDDSMNDDLPNSPTLDIVDKFSKRNDNDQSAPETADRILRAKYTVMSKQLASASELRKKMEEQVRDTQKQLQSEREEKKSLQKRMSLMEAELRKNSKRMPTAAEPPTQSENLAQEVAQLKKDLETAQRLVKQAETSTKSKDAQLKRA
eukprot:CAMPEP_0170419574 /NCGR_PEP_ID=MMETSP0117_2-20130122/34875_1 /TAXON_ID=400756 /ORGANISM="Durinskia baltica, Strain CSIRO CS-38" /LENGTH=222 /DNA_ID=CAMNT_0010677941 /DNA_START=104 /DNA_END=768 /DNA_ORIENTATION=-